MGFLKYFALFVFAGWMFFTGFFVGRGTAPVTFDTVSFQKRLGLIVQEYVQDQGIAAKHDFEFYEVLKVPVQTSGSSVDKSEEILPGKIKKTDGENLTNVTPQGVPIIRSRKAMTFKPELVAEHNRKKTKKEVKPKAKPRIKSSPEPLKKNSHRKLPENSNESLPGDDNYMIQVAAYKN
ncbi:MAG: hypothetical protein U9N77_02680, partial [Thermodesulfobacteriota bacterium]|nr:hypothetical protein [Thermodesulfobacteriota bacterium]